jgi:hypothetical protein
MGGFDVQLKKRERNGAKLLENISFAPFFALESVKNAKKGENERI